MRVVDVHERELPAPPEVVAPLVDDLDRIWPVNRWPALRWDGDEARFGFMRWNVVAREPGRLVFDIRAPRGITGEHRFEVAPAAGGAAILRHTVDVDTHGSAQLTWPLAIGPLHDALLEDVLDRAEESVGGAPVARPFSRRVRLLRRAARRVA
jgi:hypothetical protein